MHLPYVYFMSVWQQEWNSVGPTVREFEKTPYVVILHREEKVFTLSLFMDLLENEIYHALLFHQVS